MFIKKEACPNCRKQGKDTAGDNLNIYTNGKHCYACGHHEQVQTELKEKKRVIAPELVTNHIPQKFINYYKQYGLTEDEIYRYFVYSKKLDRCGYISGNFSTYRSLENKPKVLSFGPKPLTFIGNGNFIVCVEDIVSAIRVGRYGAAFPIHGSSLTHEQKGYLHTFSCPIVFWLDKDKLKEAIEYRDLFRSTGRESEAIFTIKDPKECAPELIEKKLLELKFNRKQRVGQKVEKGTKYNEYSANLSSRLWKLSSSIPPVDHEEDYPELEEDQYAIRVSSDSGWSIINSVDLTDEFNSNSFHNWEILILGNAIFPHTDSYYECRTIRMRGRYGLYRLISKTTDVFHTRPEHLAEWDFTDKLLVKTTVGHFHPKAGPVSPLDSPETEIWAEYTDQMVADYMHAGMQVLGPSDRPLNIYRSPAQPRFNWALQEQLVYPPGRTILVYNVMAI